MLEAERGERCAARYEFCTNVFYVIRTLCNMKSNLASQGRLVATCNTIVFHGNIQGAFVKEDVDVIIAKLKAKFRVRTDTELATALHLGRSTIAAWKNRESIPEKYVQIANGEYLHEFYGETPWRLWAPLEQAGMELAIMRLMRDYSEMLADYSAFLKDGPSVPVVLADYHGKAISDLAEKMADLGLEDEKRALHLLVFEEFFKVK